MVKCSIDPLSPDAQIKKEKKEEPYERNSCLTLRLQILSAGELNHYAAISPRFKHSKSICRKMHTYIHTHEHTTRGKCACVCAYLCMFACTFRAILLGMIRSIWNIWQNKARYFNVQCNTLGVFMNDKCVNQCKSYFLMDSFISWFFFHFLSSMRTIVNFMSEKQKENNNSNLYLWCCSFLLLRVRERLNSKRTYRSFSHISWCFCQIKMNLRQNWCQKIWV